MAASNLSASEHKNILGAVTRIWTDILRVEQVDLEDNFFHLGGDSLKASIMMMQIQKDLHVSLDPIEIFDTPVLKDFAESLASILKNSDAAAI